jgi:hypothetical protein
MSEIVNQLRPHATVLFSESFAATNEREGADRQPDGTRTFKLIEAKPLETSYGKDL